MCECVCVCVCVTLCLLLCVREAEYVGAACKVVVYEMHLDGALWWCRINVKL